MRMCDAWVMLLMLMLMLMWMWMWHDVLVMSMLRVHVMCVMDVLVFVAM